MTAEHEQTPLDQFPGYQRIPEGLQKKELFRLMCSIVELVPTWMVVGGVDGSEKQTLFGADRAVTNDRRKPESEQHTRHLLEELGKARRQVYDSWAAQMRDRVYEYVPEGNEAAERAIGFWKQVFDEADRVGLSVEDYLARPGYEFLDMAYGQFCRYVPREGDEVGRRRVQQLAAGLMADPLTHVDNTITLQLVLATQRDLCVADANLYGRDKYYPPWGSHRVLGSIAEKTFQRGNGRYPYRYDYDEARVVISALLEKGLSGGEGLSVADVCEYVDLDEGSAAHFLGWLVDTFVVFEHPSVSEGVVESDTSRVVFSKRLFESYTSRVVGVHPRWGGVEVHNSTVLRFLGIDSLVSSPPTFADFEPLVEHEDELVDAVSRVVVARERFVCSLLDVDHSSLFGPLLFNGGGVLAFVRRLVSLDRVPGEDVENLSVDEYRKVVLDRMSSLTANYELLGELLEEAQAGNSQPFYIVGLGREDALGSPVGVWSVYECRFNNLPRQGMDIDSLVTDDLLGGPDELVLRGVVDVLSGKTDNAWPTYIRVVEGSRVVREAQIDLSHEGNPTLYLPESSERMPILRDLDVD